MNRGVLDGIAFNLITDAEHFYKQNCSFSANHFQALYSMFGQPFVRAIELLEKGRFTQFETSKKLKTIYKVGRRYDQYTLFPNLNFCRCDFFEKQVLTGKYLTCEHVLAAKIADISHKFKLETISDGVLADLLSDQLEELD